jgi:tol-pal system protein YbgF
MIMKQSLRATTLLLLFGFSLATSARAADKETLQMMADIRMLQEQAQQLQNLLGLVSEALKAVSGRLDQQTEVSRKAFADQKATIDTLAADVRVVRERVNDSNVRIGSVSQEVEALRQSVELLNAMAPPAPPPLPVDPAAAPTTADGTPGVAATPPPAPAVPRSAAVGLSPTRLFDEAKAMYWAGQNDLAVMGFDSYIKTFPRSEQADDAQLLIGSAYLQAGDNDKAVEAYDVAIRTYPNSNVLPEAYYKKGVALQNLKQLDRAREAFETVTTQYPDSFEATLAKQGIQKLDEVRKP